MTDSKLSYIDTGKGKETLLFIHGFCGSHEYWSDIIAGLKEEYRVIAVDLRGHGASEEIGESFSIEDMAADIASFLEELEIGQVYMFGHSLGDISPWHSQKGFLGNCLVFHWYIPPLSRMMRLERRGA